MSDESIAIILHRLDELDFKLIDIQEHVRLTNGRVTDLEMSEATWKAEKEISRRKNNMLMMIGGTIISGLVISLVVWFIMNSVNKGAI